MPPQGTYAPEQLVFWETLPFLNNRNAQFMQLPGWGMTQLYGYDVFNMQKNPLTGVSGILHVREITG